MDWLNFFYKRARNLNRNAQGSPMRNRAHFISTVMCKGGVGKTTVTRMLAEFLSESGFKVLVVDADPQGNSTLSFQISSKGFEINENTAVLADILGGQSSLEEATIELKTNLFLIPSTTINTLCDKIMEQKKFLVKDLKKSFKSAAQNYDYILFDTAPSLNMLNAAIIIASDWALLPVSLDEFSRAGAIQTLQEISDLKKYFKTQVQPKIIINKYSKNPSSIKCLDSFVEEFEGLLMSSLISNSASLHERVLDYGVTSSDSDFKSLSDEVVEISKSKGDLHA